VFGAAWNGIKSIWSAVTGFFSGIWNGITRIFSVVGGWFKNVFSTAWNGVKNVWSAVTGFFSGIWSGIKKVFSVVGGWFRNIFSGAWSGIKNVWSGVSGWFGGVWSGITKVFSSVSGWFGARFRDAWNAITGVFKGIGGWFGNKFNEAKKAILSIFKPNMLSDTGRQLIEGLWNGIKNMGKWIKDKISGFGKGVLDSLKGFFGIHSPSTVFRDEIGKMIPPGIAIGFEKSTPSAIKDMQSEMAGMVSRMQASISAQQMKAGMYANAGTPQLIPALATAGAPTYNQTVNNYSPKPLSPAESARLTRNSTRQMLLSVKKR
jgi:phage-related protein